VVVPKSGHAIDQDQFMAWVNERLSKYQRITAVVVREDMPRATYGKVQKKALREEYAAATFPFSA
jgi:long-chain acyl-CoA synthetase